MNDLLFAALFVICFTYTTVDVIRRVNGWNRRFREDPHRWHARPR